MAYGDNKKVNNMFQQFDFRNRGWADNPYKTKNSSPAVPNAPEAMDPNGVTEAIPGVDYDGVTDAVPGLDYNASMDQLDQMFGSNQITDIVSQLPQDTPYDPAVDGPHPNPLGLPQDVIDTQHGVSTPRDINYFRKNIDPSNPDSVRELQSFLGVQQDGQFGPKTEAAWRKAVAGDQKSKGKDPIKYDFNDKVIQSKGLLGRVWGGLDKKLFKGKLPGGVDKKNIMTQADYDKKYNK